MTERRRAPQTERVAVVVVTWNSADDLPGWLEAVAALESPPGTTAEEFRDVVVVDCASDDDSAAVAERGTAGVHPRVVRLDENRGFAGGMNAALALTDAPWILALNPDARPEPDFVVRLLERARSDPRAAAVTGRLVRPPDADGTVRLDACGMVLHRAWRHFDRGSDEVERGQYAEPEEVFGATGAATLYRRAALDDVAFPNGDRFDSLFHSYREDAELCFRLQSRGWRVLYEPSARCEHRRRVLPRNRAAQPPAVNYHSLKNRYLLRIYHQTVGNLIRTLPWTLPRDLGALVYVLLFERSSLTAYAWLWRHRNTAWSRRRWLRLRKNCPVSQWFSP